MSERIGEQFGDYRIEALLGAGAAGPVYRARHVRLDRPAALRLIAPDVAAAPDFEPRFLQAMRIAAGLRHPNIVELYDYGSLNGTPFVVEELVSDGSLRGWLEGQTRGTRGAALLRGIDMVRQAAEGFDYAHRQGIVHRAVRPENLLLDRVAGSNPDAGRFVVKISDFGLADLEERGALPYMSPEQCRGEALDGRSDIYGLGVVLYEVCTGYVPFAVKSREEAAEKHGRVQPTPPRAVRPDLPLGLEAIILRCLAKRPQERYATADELARALRDLGQTMSQTTVLPRQTAEQTLVAPPAQQPTVVARPAATVRVFNQQGVVVATKELTADGLTIGRHPDNAIALEDPAISRNHARIDWDGARATVTDLGSSNGTFLGRAQLAPNAPRPWPADQPLRIGGFRFELAPPAAAQAAPATDPLLAGLLGGAAAAPQQTTVMGGDSIRVRLELEQLTLTPGQPAIVRMTLVNNGPVRDFYTVSVEGMPGSWVRGPDAAVQVEPGGSAPAAVTISVPRNAEARAGDYPVVVRARSSNNQAISGTARARWTILPYASSSLSLAPRAVRSGTSARYLVTLRNDGNAPARYLLSAGDTYQQLGYRFDYDDLTLEPGVSDTVQLVASAPRRLFGGTRAYGFDVWADTSGEQQLTTNAELEQPPVVPLWVLPLALGLIVLFGWLLSGGLAGGPVAGLPTATAEAPTALPTEAPTPTTAPGAPQVQVFTVEPQEVLPGGAVTVTWNVQGASRVFIDQFGDVPPQGSRQHRPEGTTDYKITATGPDGQQTVRIERVTIIQPSATAAPTALPSATPTAAPSATPLPSATTAPSATPLPTATPTVPPTAVPPPPTVALLDSARNGQWLSNAGDVTFGANPQPAVAQAAIQRNLQLEDGQSYPTLLLTAPPEGTNTFIEGKLDVPSIREGQHFLSQVGFQSGSSAGPVTVEIRFGSEIVYQQQTAPDGKLLAIDVDLSRFAGQDQPLTLRVSADNSTPQPLLYWVEPRLGAPPQPR